MASGTIPFKRFSRSMHDRRHLKQVPPLVPHPNKGSAISYPVFQPLDKNVEATTALKLQSVGLCRCGQIECKPAIKTMQSPMTNRVTVTRSEAVAESSTENRPRRHLGSHRQERSSALVPTPTTGVSRRAYQAKPEHIGRHVRSSTQTRCPKVSEDLGNHPPQELKCSFRPYTP